MQSELRINQSDGFNVPLDYVGGNELLVNHPKIQVKNNNNLNALYENG